MSKLYETLKELALVMEKRAGIVQSSGPEFGWRSSIFDGDDRWHARGDISS